MPEIGRVEIQLNADASKAMREARRMEAALANLRRTLQMAPYRRTARQWFVRGWLCGVGGSALGYVAARVMLNG